MAASPATSNEALDQQHSPLHKPTPLRKHEKVINVVDNQRSLSLMKR